MPKLNNWSVTSNQDGYRAPETVKTYLIGEVTGHPKHEDGKRVQTSHVVGVNGRLITTASGTVYELQDPHRDYVAWCDEHNEHLDPENPIRTKPRTWLN